MRWHRRRRVTQRLRGNLHQPFGLRLISLLHSTSGADATAAHRDRSHSIEMRRLEKLRGIRMKPHEVIAVIVAEYEYDVALRCRVLRLGMPGRDHAQQQDESDHSVSAHDAPLRLSR